jgi:cytochrome c-type biogenesis protein CcmE
LLDEKGNESKVVYNNPEPADFDRSEKIVIVGSMDGEHFKADKILLKCPSKYTDGQVKTAGASL